MKYCNRNILIIIIKQKKQTESKRKKCPVLPACVLLLNYIMMISMDSKSAGPSAAIFQVHVCCLMACRRDVDCLCPKFAKSFMSNCMSELHQNLWRTHVLRRFLWRTSQVDGRCAPHLTSDFFQTQKLFQTQRTHAEICGGHVWRTFWWNSDQK